MDEFPLIDVSKLFPDYDAADAIRHDGIAVVRLHKEGKQTILRLSINHMYQVLNQLRAQGPQSAGRRK